MAVACDDRQLALDALEQLHGINGPAVYLLDLIPLVEMAWADGRCRPAEANLVYEFARRRVRELSEEAGGEAVVTSADAEAFVNRFLGQPPRSGMLPEIRRLAACVIFDHSDPAVNERRRRAVLEYCLDIGAASVGRYPYGPHERFGARKKALLLELADHFHH